MTGISAGKIALPIRWFRAEFARATPTCSSRLTLPYLRRVVRPSPKPPAKPSKATKTVVSISRSFVTEKKTKRPIAAISPITKYRKRYLRSDASDVCARSLSLSELAISCPICSEVTRCCIGLGRGMLIDVNLAIKLATTSPFAESCDSSDMPSPSISSANESSSADAAPCESDADRAISSSRASLGVSSDALNFLPAFFNYALLRSPRQ